MFEQEPPPPPRRTRADLMRDVDADYYGYRDDDDGILIPLELEAEKEGKYILLAFQPCFARESLTSLTHLISPYIGKTFFN